MSAVALVEDLTQRRARQHPDRQPRHRDTTDLGAVMQDLARIDVTVRTGDTSRGAAADWDPANRTVTLRPDTTLHATLWLLNDLYLLHTDPAHVSPSVPTPLLQLVQP